MCQLLDVLGGNKDRQTEVHTLEALVPQPRALYIEMTVDELIKF